jgi:hypothetical protein
MEARKYRLTPTEVLVDALDRFTKARDAVVAPPTATVREVVKRDEHGRIEQVMDRPVTLANADDVQAATEAVTEAATKAIDAATGIVQEAKAQAAAQVAGSVVEAAREVARDAVREVVEDFKRLDDEDPAEAEEDDELDALAVARDYLVDYEPEVFKSPAKAKADREQALIDGVDEAANKTITTLVRRITQHAAIIDAIKYVVDEFDGDLARIQVFFKVARETPMGRNHPFVVDERLRAFRFPDSDQGRMSDETSLEEDEVGKRSKRPTYKRGPGDQPPVFTGRRWNGFRFEG